MLYINIWGVKSKHVFFSEFVFIHKKTIFEEEARPYECLSVCQNKEKDENNNIFSTKYNFWSGQDID